MRFEDLLRPTPKGLYCPPGDFFIDPVRPVERALVTHGHADHARPGHANVMATRETLDIMGIRYGDGFAGATQEAAYGEVLEINGVTVSWHPAGHVLGAAQIAVEKDGTRIVASGDYKRRRDPTCAMFEPVSCDVFITEATFGLPVFRHPDDREEIGKLLKSVAQFPQSAHLVGAYALGKAQRVIALLREAGYGETIYIHGAMQKLCDYYESRGIELGPLAPATIDEGREGPVRRRHRHRPALGLRRPLGAPLSRSRLLLRLGLDAGAPARQTARRRTAADPVGPLRLGRTDGDHPRDRPAGGLGHPRPRGGAGALVRTEPDPRQAAQHRRLRGRGGMKPFAELLDRLVLTPSRNAKLKLLVDYLAATPDPDRGYAIAAITRDLDIMSVKPAMIRALVSERVDEVLFGYSYDFVGDLAETVSLIWPAPEAENPEADLRLPPPGSAIVEKAFSGRSRPRAPTGRNWSRLARRSRFLKAATRC
jgi:hypothetical protein